jgi:two-component system, OmpR family, sensor histidine kinase SenX3
MDAEKKQIDFPEFLASIAHDMKNSLGMLLNTTDEILNNCSAENCPSYKQISELQYEAKRINNSLVQLLSLYKMDIAQYTLNISYNSVSDFIEEIVIQNRPLLEFKGITTEVNCPEDLEWFFDCDLVAGIINNVINNAFRYTKDMIEISACKENDYLVISVEDNGIGYPEHMLGNQFHIRSSTDFNAGSTGLGLYFASIVSKMHKNKNREGFISTSNGGRYGGGLLKIYLP